MTARNSSRSIAYARVSTPGQAASGLGIAAQVDRCESYATVMGYLPVSTVTDEGISGSVPPDERPGLGPALADLDAGRADVLIVASLSRLGRRTRDVLDVADRAEAGGWGLVILDLRMDTTSPTGRLALTVLAAVAELEREQTRQRTTAALAAARDRGNGSAVPYPPRP